MFTIWVKKKKQKQLFFWRNIVMWCIHTRQDQLNPTWTLAFSTQSVESNNILQHKILSFKKMQSPWKTIIFMCYKNYYMEEEDGGLFSYHICIISNLIWRPNLNVGFQKRALRNSVRNLAPPCHILSIGKNWHLVSPILIVLLDTIGKLRCDVTNTKCSPNIICHSL